MPLDSKSQTRLAYVHPDLRKVIMECDRITHIPFMVAETIRSTAQQQKNIAAGVSWTLKSRHIKAPDGWVYAADCIPLVGGKATWSWPIYYKFAAVMKQAAINVGVKVEWGGDWSAKNRDGPHWQLPWATYPGKK